MHTADSYTCHTSQASGHRHIILLMQFLASGSGGKGYMSTEDKGNSPYHYRVRLCCCL